MDSNISLTSDEKLEICKQCEHLKPVLIQCSLCGCLMFFKTKIDTAKCPAGKW